MPVQYVPLVEEEDVIRETTKVTTGLFTGGVGALAGTNLVTKSLSSTQKNYYYNLQYSSEDQMSVTWGHYRGSGSDKHPENDKIVGETEAIYKYFANLVLRDEDADKGLIFSGSTTFEPDIYAISIERARFKDRVNKKNWTLHLSGSNSASVVDCDAGLKLTDDSNTVAPVATPVGDRHSVVSGTLGTVHTPASTKEYGWFYPELGLLLLRGSELSSSLSGRPGLQGTGSVGHGLGADQNYLHHGLAPELNNDGTADNAFKMVLAIREGTGTTFRSEEDQTTVSYFCRAKATQFNFSNNPTFTSGSEDRMRNSDFESNPQTFITTVGLFDANTELVAIGKLSSPVQKNYSTEATIKVNLTY